MDTRELAKRIEQLQEQRQSQPDYDIALETELYKLTEELIKIKQSQHTRELAAFIAKDNKWI